MPLNYGVRGENFEPSKGARGESIGHEQADDCFEGDLTTCSKAHNTDETGLVTPTNERKAICVQRLIDKKIERLEKSLSSVQRDQLLFNECKEDAI